MLWEDQFYEDGVSIADRIATLAKSVKPEIVADIAIKAREDGKLRHVPMLLVRELARTGFRVSGVLSRIIQRADELAEFLALYWKDGRCPVSAQVKKGLAEAFTKFNEYELAKYNRDGAVKLRDVLFLCHAKPKDDKQADLWKRLVDGKLTVPDTWETALSSADGVDKKEKWGRLVGEGKLGALALLRNLRNITDAGVSDDLVRNSLSVMKADRVLPFRFISAARFAPQFEPELESAMFKSIESMDKMSGSTVVLVDVSGSMDSPVSNKSDLTRLDAACGVAMMARELCEKVAIVTFSNNAVVVPARRGFALRDAIVSSQGHGGTYLAQAVAVINEKVKYDRIIVITDEQSHDSIVNPIGKGYIVNVGSYERGVGYGPWTHINGWSESVLNYIAKN
jgi:hypothetical protein